MIAITGRPTLTAVVMMAGGAIVSLTTPALWHSPGSLNLINGAWTLAYEKAFDEKLSIRETSISFWANVQYFLFGEGRTGVLVGDDGWLFTTEEFSQPAGALDEIAAKLALVEQVQDRLAAQDIELIVALLPDKSRVYPELLGRYERPPSVATRYDDFHAALLAKGIVAPDVRASLDAAKAQSPVFLRTDTHWSTLGADIAAQLIAGNMPSVGWDADPLPMQTTAGATTPYQGDLMKYLPLGPLAAYGPAPDQIVEETTLPIEGDDMDLFGDAALEVALVGTSYSANTKWNFAGALAQHLQRDVLNMALEGRGPIVPMLEYLESDEFKNSPPKVVIWEIPERFLPVVYDTADEVLP